MCRPLYFEIQMSAFLGSGWFSRNHLRLRKMSVCLSPSVFVSLCLPSPFHLLFSPHFPLPSSSPSIFYSLAITYFSLFPFLFVNLFPASPSPLSSSRSPPYLGAASLMSLFLTNPQHLALSRTLPPPLSHLLLVRIPWQLGPFPLY